MALPEDGETVFPGTYTTHFVPSLTLTIGSEVDLSCAPGYECRGDVDVNQAGWLWFEFGDSPAFELGVLRIDKVFDPKHPGKVIAPPKDFAAAITRQAGLTVVAPPRATTIGGINATQLDILVGAKAVAFGPQGGLPARIRAQLTLLRVNGHQILIQIDAMEDGSAHFGAAVRALRPLVESIVWSHAP